NLRAANARKGRCICSAVLMIVARSKRHDSAICNGTESQGRKVTEYQPPSRVPCGRYAPRRFLISVTSGTPSKESFEFIPLSIAGHASKRFCKEHGRDARATFYVLYSCVPSGKKYLVANVLEIIPLGGIGELGSN